MKKTRLDSLIIFHPGNIHTTNIWGVNIRNTGMCFYGFYEIQLTNHQNCSNQTWKLRQLQNLEAEAEILKNKIASIIEIIKSTTGRTI